MGCSLPMPDSAPLPIEETNTHYNLHLHPTRGNDFKTKQSLKNKQTNKQTKRNDCGESQGKIPESTREKVRMTNDIPPPLPPSHCREDVTPLWTDGARAAPVAQLWYAPASRRASERLPPAVARAHTRACELRSSRRRHHIRLRWREEECHGALEESRALLSSYHRGADDRSRSFFTRPKNYLLVFDFSFLFSLLRNTETADERLST